ncbi:YciI family protein [Nocardia callitridis]|uniref:YciI family protein n=1 Tax=Nocardia callitridis TaxID=648753 RepID=A0ABP9KFV7_9NOCA
MPTFAVHYTYTAAGAPGRDVHRPEHRAWLADLVEAGALLSVGPYPDGSGALLVFRYDDEQQLANLVAEDPFARENLIEAVRVVEWQPVLGAFAS